MIFVMRSIRAKILIIVLVFISLMGAAFVLYSMAATVNYKQIRLEGIEKTVEYETEKVNRIIGEIEQAAIFYSIGGLFSFQSGSQEFSQKLTVEYLNSFPALTGGGIWFEPYAFAPDMARAGFYAYYDKIAMKARFDDTFNINEYDYHNRSWYREIIGDTARPFHVAWTRPYLDDSGSFSMMTTAGCGIFDENKKLIGISTVDWEIHDVVMELNSIKPTRNSFVLLCVPEKDYVISSTRTNSVTGASLNSIPWDITADIFSFNGIEYMRFGRYMDNGWLLSIQIPVNEIFAEVERQNNRFSMLIAFLSVAMLLLAFLLISKLINAPIKQLTNDVSQLALGNLDTQIKIKSRDELGKFADVFNKMTRDLKESIEEMARERAEKERISAELSIAAEIQSSMIPCIFPPFPDRKEFDLYASMLPAKAVGGDFYDFFFINRDNLVIVIADVSGKGVPAALFMVITKTLIKNCSACKSPMAVFDSVNNKLCEGNDTGMFVTSFIGFYNIPSGKLTYVNAGHNPPLIKRKGGDYEFLKTDPCLVLAFLRDTKYKEEEIFLESGDIIYLYTDGVTEAMNQEKELFTETRLVSALNKNKELNPRDLLFAVKQEVDNFSSGAEQTDDITMLALQITNYEPKMDSGLIFEKEISIEAKIDNLDRVLNFINSVLKKHEYPSDLQNEIDIAVEEIFVNIANYAYKPLNGNAFISIFANDKTIIKFEDTGMPYNPLEQSNPDFDKPLTAREIGGLGVFLVKKIMDTVDYARVDNKNVLIITKDH
ncbi:MAG: SpoIIE family protein phosphatase [Treponema sp.]|nr:SpoIIE family protein phosphatase [Treponema sp.]